MTTLPSDRVRPSDPGRPNRGVMLQTAPAAAQLLGSGDPGPGKTAPRHAERPCFPGSVQTEIRTTSTTGRDSSGKPVASLKRNPVPSDPRTIDQVIE